jgi:hypothetical protein
VGVADLNELDVVVEGVLEGGAGAVAFVGDERDRVGAQEGFGVAVEGA